jgi:hypothetical protein
MKTQSQLLFKKDAIRQSKSVIFQKIGSDYQILTIWPRGDVYK